MVKTPLTRLHIFTWVSFVFSLLLFFFYEFSTIISCWHLKMKIILNTTPNVYIYISFVTDTAPASLLFCSSINYSIFAHGLRCSLWWSAEYGLLNYEWITVAFKPGFTSSCSHRTPWKTHHCNSVIAARISSWGILSSRSLEHMVHNWWLYLERWMF